MKLEIITFITFFLSFYERFLPANPIIQNTKGALGTNGIIQLGHFHTTLDEYKVIYPNGTFD